MAINPIDELDAAFGAALDRTNVDPLDALLNEATGRAQGLGSRAIPVQFSSFRDYSPTGALKMYPGYKSTINTGDLGALFKDMNDEQLKTVAASKADPDLAKIASDEIAWRTTFQGKLAGLSPQQLAQLKQRAIDFTTSSLDVHSKVPTAYSQTYYKGGRSMGAMIDAAIAAAGTGGGAGGGGPAEPTQVAGANTAASPPQEVPSEPTWPPAGPQTPVDVADLGFQRDVQPFTVRSLPGEAVAAAASPPSGGLIPSAAAAEVQQEWNPTKLSPEDEKKFQTWFAGPALKEWRDALHAKFNEWPNPDDPMYDYRGAWKAGILPEPYALDNGFPHWPDQTPEGQWLKSPDHPTRWTGEFQNATGIDPYSIGITTPEAAQSYLQAHQTIEGDKGAAALDQAFEDQITKPDETVTNLDQAFGRAANPDPIAKIVKEAVDRAMEGGLSEALQPTHPLALDYHYNGPDGTQTTGDKLYNWGVAAPINAATGTIYAIGGLLAGLVGAVHETGTQMIETAKPGLAGGPEKVIGGLLQFGAGVGEYGLETGGMGLPHVPTVGEVKVPEPPKPKVEPTFAPSTGSRAASTGAIDRGRVVEDYRAQLQRYSALRGAPGTLDKEYRTILPPGKRPAALGPGQTWENLARQYLVAKRLELRDKGVELPSVQPGRGVATPAAPMTTNLLSAPQGPPSLVPTPAEQAAIRKFLQTGKKEDLAAVRMGVPIPEFKGEEPPGGRRVIVGSIEQPTPTSQIIKYQQEQVDKYAEDVAKWVVETSNKTAERATKTRAKGQASEPTVAPAAQPIPKEATPLIEVQLKIAGDKALDQAAIAAVSLPENQAALNSTVTKAVSATTVATKRAAEQVERALEPVVKALPEGEQAALLEKTPGERAIALLQHPDPNIAKVAARQLNRRARTREAFARLVNVERPFNVPTRGEAMPRALVEQPGGEGAARVISGESHPSVALTGHIEEGAPVERDLFGNPKPLEAPRPLVGTGKKPEVAPLPERPGGGPMFPAGAGLAPRPVPGGPMPAIPPVAPISTASNRGFFGWLGSTEKLALVNDIGVQMRNVWDFYGRTGVDALSRVFENALTRLHNTLNPRGALPVLPVRPFEEGKQFFKYEGQRILGRRAKMNTSAGQMIKRLEAYTGQPLVGKHTRLNARGIPVTTEGSLIPSRGGDKLTRALTALPSEFEYPTTFASFLAHLDRNMRGRTGMSLDQALSHGYPPSGLQMMINDAVDHALNIGMRGSVRRLSSTEQVLKGRNSPYEYAYDHFFDAALRTTGTGPGKFLTAVGAIFSRFMISSLRFVLQHMPTGFLRIAPDLYRAAGYGKHPFVMERFIKNLSRELTGAGLFTFALAIRSGALKGIFDPGENYDEIKLFGRDDLKLSTKYFVTLAPFMFLADLALRINNETAGTPANFDTVKGALKTMLQNNPALPTAWAHWLGLEKGTEGKTGLASTPKPLDFYTGLFGGAPQLTAVSDFFQNTLDAIAGAPDLKGKMEKGLGVAGADIAARFMRPLNILNGFVQEFRDSAGLTREQASQPERILKRSIPFVNEQMPEKQSGTRAATPRSSFPTGLGLSSGLVKELTGLVFKEPSNPIETELGKMGFGPNDINPGTGDPRYNELVRSFQGPIVEAIGNTIVTSETYQRLPLSMKIAFLKAVVLDPARQVSTQIAGTVSPGLKLQQSFQQLPDIQKRILKAVLDEQGARSGNSLTLDEFGAKIRDFADKDARRLGL